MIEGDFVVKERDIWDPRSLQLLREKAAVQCALEVVPGMIDGTRIGFPETEVSPGFRISVRSRRIKGQSLLEMLYTQETREFALDMAIVVLKALSRADVTSEPFVLFGMAYRLVRKLKVTLSERLGVPILSLEQSVRLNGLVSNYIKTRRGERKVLVHGDLHAGNVVVNCEERSLKFIDLEMMHIGKPATNFAQLWISFHFADPSLGQKFYQRYVNEFPEMLDGYFDSDVRAEVALRCHALVREAKKSEHVELEEKARILLENVLTGESFEELVLS